MLSLRSEAADVDKDRNHLPKKMKAIGTLETTSKGMITRTLVVNQAKQDRLKKTDANKAAFE